jgi:ubiquitin-activating enzyme E1
LESGTLGTKGNTQVVLPFVTESYSSSQDPPEKSFPICTLKNFPNQIEHTIAWARDLFEGYFKQPAENVNLYLSQPNFVESTLKQASNPKEMLQSLQSFLVTERPLSFEQCIQWARLQFQKCFSNEIEQLLYNFPRDSVTSSGTPFWTGPKRAPEPIVFDQACKEHVDFIRAAANLHAFNYGLKVPSSDPEYYSRVLAGIEVPKFVPQSGLRIQTSDNEPDPNAQQNSVIEADDLARLAEGLPQPSTLAGFRLTPAEFEKDDDTNYHIDFVTATSNLRAANYSIQPADRHRTKMIAGKIIPAIATTTALVAGLVCLELYKVIGGQWKLERFKNSFVNLALPFVSSSEPIASAKGRIGDYEFDRVWGRFEFDRDLTLRELLAHFEQSKGLTVTMLSCGVSLLYASFYIGPKYAERMDMKVSELVLLITKKEVPAHQRSVILEACTEDAEGEEVEIPYITVKVR